MPFAIRKISPDELKALMTSLGEKIADEEIKSIISVYQTTHH